MTRLRLAVVLALFGSLAAAGDRPNILIAVADDWGMHAGAYGTRWIRTPNFDRIASHGLIFANAYTPNAKCAPSRACMLTGRNSWQLRAAANHWCFFPPQFKTWGEALEDHGWSVGHTNKGWAPGIAKDTAGRPRQLIGKAWNAHRTQPPTQWISRNDYAANFNAFLDATPEDTPWVFWYGSGEPHRRYAYGSSTERGRDPASIDQVPAYWPDNEIVRTDMLDYAIEVEHFDDHLGRMLDSLEKRGQLESTLVVVTSDHGMPFPRAKGAAYEASNHVPLAMMWPKGIESPNRTIESYVSLIDLAASFVELAGLSWDQTGMAASPGISLTHLFDPKSSHPHREHVLIGKERHDIGRPFDRGYPIRGLVRDGFLYLKNLKPDRWPHGNPETGYLNADGGATKTEILRAHRRNPDHRPWQLCFGKRPAVELYDLKEDPDCVRNLAAESDRVEHFDRILQSELEKQNDPRMLGRGRVFDEYPYADAKRRGFYERFMRGEKIPTRWVNPEDFEKHGSTR